MIKCSSFYLCPPIKKRKPNLVPGSLNDGHCIYSMDSHHLMILSSLDKISSSLSRCFIKELSAHPAYLRNPLCLSFHCYLSANIVKKQANSQRKSYSSGHLITPISIQKFFFATTCHRVKIFIVSNLSTLL